MSLKDIVILIVVVVGVVVFLYGSNSYDAVSGWGGLVLAAAVVIAYLALEIYGVLGKKRKLETVES